MPAKRVSTKGLAAILLSALAFGIGTVVSKAGLNTGIDSVSFSFVSMLASAFILLPFYFMQKRPRFNAADYRNFALIGLFSSGVATLAFFYGLSLTTAVNFSLLIPTATLFTFVFAYFMLGERLERSDFFAAALMLVGTFLLATRGEELSFHLGDLAILVGTASLGFSNVLSKKVLGRHRPGVVVFWRVVFGTAVIGLFAFFVSPSLFSALGIYSLANGLMNSLSLIFLYIGFRELDVSLSAVLLLVSPLAGTGMAILFLGEVLLPLQALGGALIFGGAAVVAKS